MSAAIWFIVGLIIGAGGGWWAKGKYAAKAAADLAAIKKAL